MLVLAEDVREVGHDLLAVVDERIVGFFPGGMRWLARTTELSLTGALRRSGTLMSVSKEPMRPVSFSRTTNLRWNFPAGRVKLVEYWMLRWRTCCD